MHMFAILTRLAWRNLWRNHRRTFIMLAAIILGSWAMIFMTALMRGMVTDVITDGISALPGHVQVHHPDYRDDPSVANLIPVPDSAMAANFAAAGLEGWASRVRVPAVITSEYESRGVTLLGIDPAREPDATGIVRDAVNHWRGVSSDSVMTMVIHRPDWERSMTMRAWTKGDKKSLVRVLEPRKDRGNGTLTDDNNMWSYSPKINRVIKIPSSMMGQSWMGSDFSNNDVARADDIIDQYDHSILSVTEAEGITIYEIESVPHEEAAVVWGREVLQIREDHVVISHRFYDQDGELVKQLTSLEIGEMGGRLVALRQRMAKVETEDEWTEIQLDSIEYDVDLKDSLFTLSNLRNPRD